MPDYVNIVWRLQYIVHSPCSYTVLHEREIAEISVETYAMQRVTTDGSVSSRPKAKKKVFDPTLRSALH